MSSALKALTALSLPALALMSFASLASADEPKYQPLDKAALNALLSGQTITGEYRFLRERTKTYMFSETHAKDGSVLYREGHLEQAGQWYTLGARKICYRYEKDQVVTGTHCFWVYDDRGCYYGYSLRGMTIKGPRDFEDWEARWIIEGSGKTCASSVS